MMGQLIKASGRKMGLSLHRFTQHTGVSHAAVIVHIGVASIKGHRISTVLVLHRRQLFRDCTKRLFPTDLDPAITLFLDWPAQAIRVGVDILHRCAFGADIAMA